MATPVSSCLKNVFIGPPFTQARCWRKLVLARDRTAHRWPSSPDSSETRHARLCQISPGQKTAAPANICERRNSFLACSDRRVELEADEMIAPFVDFLERESRNLLQILERLARTVLGPVRNPRRCFFPQQRHHTLELDRRGAVQIELERFRRLALELVGEVIKDLLQLVLAGLHAEVGHLREHAFPSLARETDGGRALRLVTLAADAHGHVLARAVGQFLREPLGAER